MKQLRWLMIGSLIAICTGCGFHLRGAVNLPQNLHSLSLQSATAYSPFAQVLRQDLQYAQVRVIDHAASGITLKLLQESFTTPPESIGVSSATRAYQASYSVSYQLQDATGQVIVGPLSASASQIIEVMSNEVLENSNKLQQAKEDLYHDVAQKIILQLSSKHTAEAVAKHATSHHS